MEFARRSQPVGTQGSPTENLLGPAFAATLDRRRRRYALPPSTVAEVAPVDAFYDRLATPPPAPPAPEPASEFQVSPCATMPPPASCIRATDGIADQPVRGDATGASSCSRAVRRSADHEDVAVGAATDRVPHRLRCHSRARRALGAASSPHLTRELELSRRERRARRWRQPSGALAVRSAGRARPSRPSIGALRG